ncbi:PYRUVATE DEHYDROGENASE E1 BETA family protein [Hibiscus syriacus]|uniref:Aldose 1-epimerase n=1 Tax=Hibiscus syriacus TaxID=106335 RepID=A0A6A2WNV0_HIBSY|nr:galactose mutarotase-like [Hibiscus syriacus]KAE8661321.1 PYRUVATE DEHYDROGENASE E1 BETA family protein [Hibiscus syriacus]
MAKISFLLFSLFIIVASAIINGSEAKEKVGIYELKKGDLSVKFTNWGATIVSVIFPDKYGKLGDIVLGYDSVKEYMNDTSYIGSIVGRVANRIAGAQFTLNGVHYKLVPNEGKNMLHGGPVGFSDVVWKVKKYKKDGYAPSIVFANHSFDGEEGFPGALEVTVAYTLHPGNRLSVKMKAKALNKATPVNLVQHTYWNLGNHNSGDILSEQLQLFASHYTPVDSQLIPTGEIATVKGTPYDFLKPHTVGSRIDKLTKGYDINYVIDGAPGKLKKTAIVKDDKTGRVMELFTNQPGVQFYSAKFLKDVKGKGGYVYQPFGAFCLDTRAFPDSVNNPNFPSTIIYPGKDYKHVMEFKFSISS